MDIKELKLLTNIQNCINHIGDNKVFEVYANNPLLQDAVERNIITIGEAMNVLLKLNPQIKITNARRIVDARNKLTHGYDEIEVVQIWSIIVKHLPTLKNEVGSFLTSK